MASNRHLGRIVVLQTLYEFDFRKESKDPDVDIEAILDRNVERYSETIEDKDFIRDLAMGTFKKMQELDEAIQPIAPEWPIEQIARIDRNILRMSLWELTHGKDVPPKVVINEAVELAKSFGGDNSSKFINGVLGTAFRNMEEGAEEAPAKKTEKKAPTKKSAKSPPAGGSSAKSQDSKKK
ncbi:MAG: transcription antitermination factor NusB [Actinomycetia bacterium]|nr:transcription antitermination factor NusB [Actinomycetes bacterium]